MRLFQRLLLAAAVAAFLYLLVTLDARAILLMAAGVGWAFAWILPQEGVCHLLNAAAWRLSFPPEQARSFRLPELWLLRVHGDALNYLTPTATIGGEVARAQLLRDAVPPSARTSSVVTAKFAQMLGQLVFVLGGFVFVVTPLIPLTAHWSRLRAGAGALLAAGLTAYLFYAVWGRRWIPAGGGEGLRPALRGYFRDHPWRLGASVAVFLCAYAWSALEAWLICRAIGLPVSPMRALAIEVLSIGIDAVLLVPGKVGTQETGKAAVFALLGLPTQAGFAFGLVRHVRELAWSLTGLAAGGLLEREARAPDAA